MFLKLFRSPIMKGTFRGIMIAFLTGCISSVFFELLSILDSLIINHKMYIDFLSLPPIEVFVIYLAYAALSFGAHFFSCIVIGVMLEFLSIKKMRVLVFALVSSITSFSIWRFILGISDLGGYVLILTIMIVSFQYLCFFVWWPTQREQAS